MYICTHRARFDWWPASYQVFPSTNGPTAAPAAGTYVGNRVNVRCPTTRNHFQRAPFLTARARVLFSHRSLSFFFYKDISIVVHEKKKKRRETNGQRKRIFREEFIKNV